MLRLLLLIVSLLAPTAAFAKAAGVDSRGKFSDHPVVSCGSSVTGMDAGCHFTDADPQLMVTIQGPSQIDVGPSGFGSYTASIPVDFMGLKGAGINVAVDAPNPSGCVLQASAPVGKIGPRNEAVGSDFILSHIGTDSPPPNLVGVWAYQFLMGNCTSPGIVSLRVAMNAFDGDATEMGELWNSASLGVMVPEPGGSALAAAAACALVPVALARKWNSVHRPKSKRPLPP